MSLLDYNYLADLVEQAQQSDSDAFAELYAATYQKQYRFAYQFLKDEYLAQDALQETYILAFKNLGTLRDPRLFISWLNQINFRICLNMQKKQQAEIPGLEGIDPDRTLNSSLPDPERTMLKVDEQSYLMKQIMALPSTDAQTILLRYYRDMKIDDIAQLLEISKSSVKRHLNSGKEALKKQLTKGEVNLT